jgi:hypothetical protein
VAMENIVEPMDQLIKESGSMVKEMEKENFVMLKDQLIKENGSLVIGIQE